MSWRDDHLEPSRQQYEEFEEDLSRKPSSKSIESGFKVFLAMLFIMPVIGFLIACLVGWFGVGCLIGFIIGRARNWKGPERYQP